METPLKNPRLGVLCTVISALLFGFTPVLAHQVMALGGNAVTLTFYRNTFCIVMAFLWVLLGKKSLRINPGQLFHLSWIGIFGVAATTVLLYASYAYIGVGTATVLHFLYPVFTAVIARWFYGDKIGRRRLVALFLSCMGLAFFLQSGGGLPGVLLSVASGVTYALYMVGMEKHGVADMETSVMTFYLAVIVAVTIFLYGSVSGQLSLGLSPVALALCAVIAAMTSFGAVALLQLGVRHLDAGTAALFCLFEPLSGVIFGKIFLQESLSWKSLAGSAIILIALILAAKSKRPT